MVQRSSRKSAPKYFTADTGSGCAGRNLLTPLVRKNIGQAANDRQAHDVQCAPGYVRQHPDDVPHRLSDLW